MSWRQRFYSATPFGVARGARTGRWMVTMEHRRVLAFALLVSWHLAFAVVPGRRCIAHGWTPWKTHLTLPPPTNTSSHLPLKSYLIGQSTGSNVRWLSISQKYVTHSGISTRSAKKRDNVRISTRTMRSCPD